MTKQQQMHHLCLWSQMITNNEASNFVESSFHCSSVTAQCLIPWQSLQPITISMWLLQITWHFWESCNSLRIFQSQIPIWKVHYAYLYTHSASHNHSNWLGNPTLHPSLNTWLWCGRILPQLLQKELSFEARVINPETGHPLHRQQSNLQLLGERHLLWFFSFLQCNSAQIQVIPGAQMGDITGDGVTLPNKDGLPSLTRRRGRTSDSYIWIIVKCISFNGAFQGILHFSLRHWSLLDM